MQDTIVSFGESLIQHGPLSNRIYLMKLAAGDSPGIVETIDQLAIVNGYTKAFAKVPAGMEQKFIARGYRIEALIPRFYRGEQDGLFLAKYFEDKREIEQKTLLLNEVLSAANARANGGITSPIPEAMKVSTAKPDILDQMAEVYRTVFATYPFPIHNAEYLRKTMNEDVRYFCCSLSGKLIALSSAEMDVKGMNVEMTDFATLPEYRGHGLALHLLELMEEEMRKAGMQVAYTIARAYSHGMNITFSRMGYVYAGTLTNNTNIGGSIESMNVWWKSLV